MESAAQKAPKILTLKWNTLLALPDDKSGKPNIGVAGQEAKKNIMTKFIY